MSVKRIDPTEAARLFEDGWVYVDVRTVAEFEQGHPAGAYNIPFQHDSLGGRVPNPDFEAVFTAVFPDKDTAIVLGCRSGARSLAAATLLAGRGYSQVIDMRGGFAGEKDSAGSVTCAGWQDRGLPIDTTARAARSWDELSGG